MSLKCNTSVPFKAVCREIVPALLKIGSTDLVKIVKKKMFFLDKLANFQPKLMILAQEPLKFSRIGLSS